MAELIVVSGPATDRRFEVGAAERFVIGRDDACSLVLDDPKVSRRHAYLQEIDDGVEVGDLGSSNGTFVNGRRIERPVTLTPGDTLRIGTSTLRIEPEVSAAATGAAVAGAGAAASEAAGAGAAASEAAGAGATPSGAAPDRPMPDDRSRIRRMISGDSSVIQRLRLERSVRRATLLAVVAVLVAAAAIVAAVTGAFSSDPEEPPTASEIIARVKPSTVRVLTRVEGRSVGGGTGWAYDGDRGLIVTNAHVVGDQETVGTTTYRVLVGDSPQPATLYANSPCYDIAMLEVDDATGLETLPLGSQQDLAQGEQVNVIGYPSNEFTNFAAIPLQSTTGTVSVVEESVQSRSEAGASPDIRRYPNVIQTDAAINHGNSGGPLVDDAGNLVGINSLTTLETQQQGFAIGVDLFKEQAPTLEQGDSIGFLGFDFIANGKGLVVNNAVDGSEAAAAGFGSEVAVVTAIDGEPVRTRADYCRAVDGAETGETARVSGLTRTGRFDVELPFL